MKPLKAHRDLPIEWVKEVWSTLLVRFGVDLLRRHEGLDILAIHSAWARELGRYLRVDKQENLHMPAVDWALENLPAGMRAPNVIEFRKLCDSAPAPEEPRALPGPVRKPPPRVARELARLRGLYGAPGRTARQGKDGEPHRVGIARRFVEKWGTPGLQLSPQQKSDLAFYREILQAWEEQRAREAERRAREEAARAEAAVMPPAPPPRDPVVAGGG